MTEDNNKNIVIHESFVEEHPRFEFIPLTREDFKVGEWIESFPEYDDDRFDNYPSMHLILTLKKPFLKEERTKYFTLCPLSFNVIYARKDLHRSWQGIAKRQSKRQEIKDKDFKTLRADIKENGEKYIDERIAKVNAKIQKFVDMRNADYAHHNSHMMLNALEVINNDWVKEEIYDFSKEVEEEELIKEEIKELQKKLKFKKYCRYKKVNVELAHFLETDKDALGSIDESLRKDICQKLREEEPKMPTSFRGIY